MGNEDKLSFICLLCQNLINLQFLILLRKLIRTQDFDPRGQNLLSSQSLPVKHDFSFILCKNRNHFSLEKKKKKKKDKLEYEIHRLHCNH